MSNNNLNLNINSNFIDVDNTPNLPPIGYFNSHGGEKTGVGFNSYEQLKNNLTNSCNNQNFSQNGLFNSLPTNCTNSNCNIPQNTSVLDAPYYLALNGELDNNTINNNNPNSDSASLINQIKYLACQLVSSRNRIYDPANFIVNSSGSISDIFGKFGSSLRIPLILLFIITMYYLVSGFFSSFDVTANIINIIQKNSSSSISYWIGLLIGISIPLMCISLGYSKMIGSNLNELDKYEITNNSQGVQNSISEDAQNIDYTTLVLFILLIYGFVGVLFTIKKSSFNNFIYTALIVVVLLIITLLLYILYAYIPFYNTTNQSYMFSISNRPLRLFINTDPTENEDISNITSNQTQDTYTRYIYLLTGIIIFILSIVYFKVSKSLKIGENDSGIMLFAKSLFNGLLGSFSILIIPILWVLNFAIGLQYFYIYPIFLIIIRFIRYFGTMILYFTTKDGLKSNFSDDLVKDLDNIKNYSPSWGLFGVQELKTFLEMFGYENLFSKSIISENNNSHNLSNNKFMASGILPFFAIDKNSGGMTLSIVITILTIIFSSIILFAVNKV